MNEKPVRWIDHEVNPSAEKIWDMVLKSKYHAVRMIYDFDNKKLYAWDASVMEHEGFIKNFGLSYCDNCGALISKEMGPNPGGTETIYDVPDRLDKLPVFKKFRKLYDERLWT